MRKATRQGICFILLLCLLLPYAGAAAKITCFNDPEDDVTGAGTARSPWVLTVGNTYTVLSGQELKSSTCLDANWYILGDNKNYIEIVGADFNTVEPKIKALAVTGDNPAQLKFTHQVYQPENGDAAVWTAADYYYFRIEEAQAAATPTKPAPKPTPKPAPALDDDDDDDRDDDRDDDDDDRPSSGGSNSPSSSASSVSSGSNDATSGTCDDALTWQVKGDTLTIRGSGEMDLHFEDAPWYEHRKNIRVVTIEPGVTKVDYAAFRDFEGLDSVSIPDTVTDLGSDIFLRCPALAYITLPDSLKKIPSTTFSGCTGLKSLDIPKGVEEIGMFAFQKCASLESISIPTSVRRIESTAFVDCTGLQEVYYDGTTAQWEAIHIGSENAALTQAVLHTSDNRNGTASANTSTGSSTASSGDFPSTPPDKTNSSQANSASSASGSTPASSPSSAIRSLHGNAWYAPAMEWAYTNSIINDADYHAPLNNCPRSSIVLYLWRAKGCPSATGKQNFPDLSSSALYYDAVQWAVEAGIVNGFADGSFRPTGTLTRAQLVTILHRMSGSGKASGSISFTDVLPAAWYEEAVQWAVSNGITKGTSASQFSPNGTCTIAQVLTFLQRLL